MLGFHQPNKVYRIEGLDFCYFMTLFWVRLFGWNVQLNELQRFMHFLLFGPHLGSVVPFNFWFCLYCLPHKMKYIVCISPCKLQNTLYVHLRSHMFLLLWYWNYNYIHDLETIFNLIPFLILPTISHCRNSVRSGYLW